MLWKHLQLNMIKFPSTTERWDFQSQRNLSRNQFSFLDTAILPAHDPYNFNPEANLRIQLNWKESDAQLISSL